MDFGHSSGSQKCVYQECCKIIYTDKIWMFL